MPPRLATGIFSGNKPAVTRRVFTLRVTAEETRNPLLRPFLNSANPGRRAVAVGEGIPLTDDAGQLRNIVTPEGIGNPDETRIEARQQAIESPIRMRPNSPHARPGGSVPLSARRTVTCLKITIFRIRTERTFVNHDNPLIPHHPFPDKIPNELPLLNHAHDWHASCVGGIAAKQRAAVTKPTKI